MQEQSSQYAVGLDVGTTTVRCVVGHIDGTSPVPTIIGVGTAENSGMRKGTVVNMVNTAQAIDKALEVAERMSGHQINEATVSVNGSHIIGMSSRGVVAVGTQSHEINQDDIFRAEEAATVVQLPANREILQVTPRSYQLDGQENIKDPMGMTGVRLEVDAHVITALVPHVKNLQKTCEMTQTMLHGMVPAGLAAARAVLSEQQMENGVILIDFGGTTTNIAVFEEGDLQHVSVLPLGSVQITNDLAIGLKTDLDIAEVVKLEHATAVKREANAPEELSVTVKDESYSFKTEDIDMIVEARLEEIFELINNELKSIGRAAKLPGGAVLVGGGANLHGIAQYCKQSLQLPARLGSLKGFGGVADKIENPSFATALGLMLLDTNSIRAKQGTTHTASEKGSAQNLKNLSGHIGNLLKKFRT
ncbi:cell division protein FtsA [Candidatus Saccharibacteria bacterium]|nr:MAG: cell division protein FtsA [Candidatus Saccharibacteria bacterium]